jgi:predicted ATPase with chaperone activity
MSAVFERTLQRTWTDDALRTSAPRSVEETGLPTLFLVELVAKILHQRGQLRLSELAAHSKLPVSVLEAVIGFLRAEKLCELSRRGTSGTDADIVYQLSDNGRARAADFARRNSYAGPAPVSLDAYVQRVQEQSLRAGLTHRPQMEQAYRNVVVAPAVLDQLGAALNSGRAIFMYGPAGSGKSYLSERLSGLLSGHIAVPYALLVDGEVIPLFDPLVHRIVPEKIPTGTLFDRRAPRDQRWVRSERPLLMCGGELTLEMLDLRFDQSTGLYQAPPHLKASGGILIVDDLGRQACPAIDLLNRWIVPMDRRVDFLSLQHGYSFPVPLDVQIVFSSNLTPAALADESILRRLGYKIHIGPLSASQYEQVFRQVCQQYALPFAADAFERLLERYDAAQMPLLACHPRDLLMQVRDLARYEGRPPKLNPGSVDWAWNNYFASH